MTSKKSDSDTISAEEINANLVDHMNPDEAVARAEEEEAARREETQAARDRAAQQNQAASTEAPAPAPSKPKS